MAAIPFDQSGISATFKKWFISRGLMIRTILLTFVLTAQVSLTYGQLDKADTLLAAASQIADDILSQNLDSSYIRSYADRISLKISAINKFNSFHLWDQSLNNRISYRPDLGVNFGLGVTYRGLALDIASSLGFKEKKISNSIYRDIQLRFLNSKHYLRLRYQYYYGYKIFQISGYNTDPLAEYETRQDIRTLQFGVQYLYTFNYGKFSMRAPFVMNERQRRSAGSTVAGVGFHIYNLDADSSLIPVEMSNQGNQDLNFSELNVAYLTAHLGYMYSFVIKGRFFITLGLIPGIGFKNGDYNVGRRTPIHSVWAARLKTMNAIGYNGQRFFTGLQIIYSLSFVPLDKDLKSSIIEGRPSLYAGFRF